VLKRLDSLCVLLKQAILAAFSLGFLLILLTLSASMLFRHHKSGDEYCAEAIGAIIFAALFVAMSKSFHRAVKEAHTEKLIESMPPRISAEMDASETGMTVLFREEDHEP